MDATSEVYGVASVEGGLGVGETRRRKLLG